VEYLVRITLRAERDLDALYEEIHGGESLAAQRWYKGLKRAIQSLRTHPKRCALAPENRRLRHLLYGRKPHFYRVIYSIRERQKQVDVLHIRHGARRQFRAPDVG
jgi:toxin ParE1/3/4